MSSHLLTWVFNLGLPKFFLAGLVNLPNLQNTGTSTIHVQLLEQYNSLI